MAAEHVTDRDGILVSSLPSVNHEQNLATEASLLSCFGYFEDSNSNLWSLMQGVSTRSGIKAILQTYSLC